MKGFMGPGLRVSWLFAVVAICWGAAGPSAYADLLLHYDFNDDSDFDIVRDVSGNDNDAAVFLAEYSEAGLGRTGADDDLAMDFLAANDGAYIDVITAIDGAFDTINENDAATVSLWAYGGEAQPVNNSVFWFYSEGASGGGRGMQAHLPWGNSNIYFDVAGCCDATQRINAATDPVFFKGRWNHYAFVKDGPIISIYQNGFLFLESAPGIASLEPYFFTNIVFGAATGGGNSYNGLLDDILVYDEALDPGDIEELAETDQDDLIVGPSPLNLRVGDERQLTVTLISGGVLTDVTAGAEGTTYAAAPDGIVTVSVDGLVTGVSVGDAVITATNGGIEATVDVSVAEAPPEAELLLWYDFNDNSDAQFVIDQSGMDNDAEIFGAEYTEDGGGRTGEEGDRAMDFLGAGDGVYISVITALDGAFDTINENDSATVAMWSRGGDAQPHNNTVFWFYSEGASGTGRGMQAHLPWSNTNIYFDVAGCCNPNQRINAPTEEQFFKGRWNHYAFVKDGTRTAIYQNGQLFLESASAIDSLEPYLFSDVVFGAATNGGNSYNGYLDEIGVWDGALSEAEIQELAASDREELTISPSQATIRVAEDFQLQVTHFDTSGAPTDVTFDADYAAAPDGIVSVSADGLVTGEAEGNAVVTASFGGLEATVEFTVLPERPVPGEPELLLWYDFNDDSDPTVVLDQSGNDNDAEVLGPLYTEDGLGRTGEDGDRAMDFLDPVDGSHLSVVTAADGAFDAINANDAATITLWVRGSDLLPATTTAFWFYGEGASGGGRVIQAHLPWSNSNIYFDVGGCCGATQRINAPTDEQFFKGEWNHYAFVKDGAERIAIYQNGILFLESFGVEIAPIDLIPITEVLIGMAQDGSNGYSGLIDDFGVWSGALSEDEILDVMEEGITQEPPPPEGPMFVRGDTNADGASNITDGVFVLNFLFGGAEAVDPPCEKSADANDDGSINIADGVFVLNFLFGGGDATDPPAPYPDCGVDPTEDMRTCLSYPPCEG